MPLTSSLEQLRELRSIIKSAEAQIAQIAGDAAQEAIHLLAKEGREKGEFEFGGHPYQLQVKRNYDFANYHKYKDDQCILWRNSAKVKADLQSKVKAQTTVMKGLYDAWVLDNPDAVPDLEELTVKCLDVE